MEQPLVSVIIPTFNSSTTIKICLNSIKNQTYSNIEVILVDSNSVDDTLKIAKKFNTRIFSFNALRSSARNYGALNAGGIFYLFLDSDMELSPDVIDACVRMSTEYDVDAIMIPEYRKGEGFWAKCREIERLTYIGNPLIESIRFFRKEVFEKESGFDEELEAGEDWDLHARTEDAGYKISSIIPRMTHHEGIVTLKKIVRKRYYYGTTLIRYIKKHPRRALIQYAPIRIDFIRNWKLLTKNPIYGCGMIMMKIIEYVVVAISILFS